MPNTTPLFDWKYGYASIVVPKEERERPAQEIWDEYFRCKQQGQLESLVRMQALMRQIIDGDDPCL